MLKLTSVERGVRYLIPSQNPVIIQNMTLQARMFQYFSREPQLTRWTGKKTPGGKEITENVPNGFISKAGFCAEEGISEQALDNLLEADANLRAVAEICATKLKYFLQVNGIVKGAWEAGAWGLIAENEIGYRKDAAPAQTTTVLVLGDADRRMLERALGGVIEQST